MAATPQHTYQVLTKRDPRPFFRWLGDEYPGSWLKICEAALARLPETSMRLCAKSHMTDPSGPWPLPNVQLGVSIENDAYRAQRLSWLCDVPNALPWVSQEPQIGPVTYTDEELSWLKWVVIGGESGAGARPFDIAWMRRTVEQCKAAGVPVFCKQVGACPIAADRVFAGLSRGVNLLATKGDDMDEWPEELRVREFPS